MSLDTPAGQRSVTARAIAACLTVALVCAGAAGRAQDWPARPVKLIVPFAPGGTADLFGRIAAEELGKAFNRQFVVENRGGAGGLVGSAAVAAAEADGYTLLVSGIPTLVVAPAPVPAGASGDPRAQRRLGLPTVPEPAQPTVSRLRAVPEPRRLRLAGTPAPVITG